jgi:hypothetical protein
MRKVCLSVLILVVLSMTAYAVTRYVPEEYATIAAAIQACSDGDSIIVGPGIYDPPPTVFNEPDNITLLGNGYTGANRTIILGNFSSEIEAKIDIRGVSGWEIGGFEMTVGHKGINSSDINNCYIHDLYVHDVTWDYAVGVELGNAYNVLVDRCIFERCTYSGIEIYYNGGTGITIRNNTILYSTGVPGWFHGNGILVRGNVPGILIENNIIGYNTGQGVEFQSSPPPPSSLDYNDVYGNQLSNWQGCTPGPHNLSVNPLFVGGTGAGQYMLQSTSPCINAGDPNSPLDPDSTVADIGCFYYDQGPGLGYVSLNLEPLSPPIIVPVPGGSFSYTITAACDTTGWAQQDYWADLLLPNGTTMGPLMVRTNVHWNAGQIIFRQPLMYVSAWAMPGTYWFRGYIGNSAMQTVMSADSFSFVKLESNTLPPPGAGAYLTLTGWDEPVTVELPTSAAALLQEMNLSASPNPFNPSTALSFKLQAASQTSLQVYDTAGRLVATLMEGWQEAGSHQATFDGSKLASGIYLAVFEAGGQRTIQRLLLMK